MHGETAPNYLKTTAVLRQHDIPYTRFWSWLRTGKLAPPRKDASGDFIWEPADIERLKAVAEAASLRKKRKAVRP